VLITDIDEVPQIRS